MNAPVDFTEARVAKNRRSAQEADASEDEVALAFTQKFAATLRFDHDARCWYEWDSTRWHPDRQKRAFAHARQTTRERGGAGKASFAAGVERFAQSDPAHRVNADIWDADPWLLGTPGGTVDLRSGKLSSALSKQHITKLTSCTPERGEPTLWLRFLNEALAGDQEAIRFLQQWFGYCLTGDTSEHAMVYGHGIGGTGKTVTLNTMSAVMGDYATAAAMETFTASKNERHSTELARLKGARLVTASETEHGKAWAEARIKALTGGDTITARFMRQDDFEYRPQFKLVIVGNHAPQMKNPDEAMRRRFNILGFNVKPAIPDRQLEQKLKVEHGRILAWAIAGCLDWQANGLVRPSTVNDATAEYFAEEDLVEQWLKLRCDRGPKQWEIPTRLFEDWKAFARAWGEDHGTQTAFGRLLTSKGYPSDDNSSVRRRLGLSLKQAQQPDD